MGENQGRIGYNCKKIEGIAMKLFLSTLFFASQLLASLEGMTSFDADFVQSITDEENKTIHYNGHIVASKPQNARWSYFKPIKKEVYINDLEATIVEPEIEQVIVRKIESNFDFFKILSKAKKKDASNYEAYYQETQFTIKMREEFIESISYKDEFENRIIIVFKNQKQNESVAKNLFTPLYPSHFDIIKD